MILAIMGRTASGKTVLSNTLKKNFGCKEMVSYTTRSPREGEVDGVDYHFISKETFQEMKENGGFVESDQYGANFYGTGRREAEEAANSNSIYVFVCTPEGAKQIQNLIGKDGVKNVYVEAPMKDRMCRFMNREGSGGWTLANIKDFEKRTEDEDLHFKDYHADYLIENRDDGFAIYQGEEKIDGFDVRPGMDLPLNLLQEEIMFSIAEKILNLTENKNKEQEDLER